MLSASEKQDFAPIKGELYQTLVSAWCYKTKFHHLAKRLETETREFLLEEVTAIRIISNDIVLRICKLDDESSKYSLHALRKHIIKTKRPENAYAESINYGMKQFRAEINNLKVKHRNDYIAHLNVAPSLNPFQIIDFQKELLSPIGRGLNLVEKMWGSRLSFEFHLGSRDPIIDFREELGL